MEYVTSQHVFLHVRILNRPIEAISMKQLFLAASLVALFISSALAGSAADAAGTHFAAIGAGDVSVNMSGYADSTHLNWVGALLDGTYTSQDNIRDPWEKFCKATGPLKVTVKNLEESINQKGATVLANVQFDGKMSVKVRYVLTCRDGELVSETWQIDPKLLVASY